MILEINKNVLVEEALSLGQKIGLGVGVAGLAGAGIADHLNDQEVQNDMNDYDKKLEELNKTKPVEPAPSSEWENKDKMMNAVNHSNNYRSFYDRDGLDKYTNDKYENLLRDSNYTKQQDLEKLKEQLQNGKINDTYYKEHEKLINDNQEAYYNNRLKDLNRETVAKYNYYDKHPIGNDHNGYINKYNPVDKMALNGAKHQVKDYYDNIYKQDLESGRNYNKDMDNYNSKLDEINNNFRPGDTNLENAKTVGLGLGAAGLGTAAGLGLLNKRSK
jgi:hypothetical protein